MKEESFKDLMSFRENLLKALDEYNQQMNK